MASRTRRLVPNSVIGLMPMPTGPSWMAVDAHLVFDELLDLLDLVGTGFPLDAGVDVLGVLPEGDHVHRRGVFDRRRDAVEVVGRADVRVEVELLAERDVERAEARTDGRRERALDGDAVVAWRFTVSSGRFSSYLSRAD